MYVEDFRCGRLPYAPEHLALSRVASCLVDVFAHAGDSFRSGLYVVSANAGFHSARTFWANAQRDGVGFASPFLFPWTLSNAPCGWLAQEFKLRGPNVTYVGGVDALVSALEQVHQHLVDAQIDVAWIAALDFAQTPAQRTAYAALRLSLRPAPVRIEPVVASDRGGTRMPRATTALCAVFRSLLRGARGTVSDGLTAWTMQRGADETVHEGNPYAAPEKMHGLVTGTISLSDKPPRASVHGPQGAGNQGPTD
jgi:hypothetical protein